MASTDANVVLHCSPEVKAHIDLVEAEEALREPSEEHECKDSETKNDHLVHDAQRWRPLARNKRRAAATCCCVSSWADLLGIVSDSLCTMSGHRFIGS